MTVSICCWQGGDISEAHMPTSIPAALCTHFAEQRGIFLVYKFHIFVNMLMSKNLQKDSQWKTISKEEL